MKRLNLVIPKTVDKAVKSILLTVQVWANSLGDIGVDKLTFFKNDLHPGVIHWPGWVIPLALPADDFVSFDTNYARCSGIFLWEPQKYPAGKWYFEASMAINNAAQTVSVRLMGEGQICELKRTGSTEMQVVRSDALSMPGQVVNLYVEIKTSSTSVQASFGNARLVFEAE